MSKKRYLGINLTKEVKDLYTDIYETLVKETKADSKEWKDISCPWIGIIHIVKMIITSRLSADSVFSSLQFSCYFV